jgi:amino acid adenylation domain-containing protein
MDQARELTAVQAAPLSQDGDHARPQRDPQQAKAPRESLSFWKEYLAGAPTVLKLPGDRHRPGGPRSGKAGTQPFELGAGLSEGLRELSRRERVTLRATLTAAFETLLHRYTGQEDLLVGLTVPGHGRPQRQQMAGRLGNTVVMRADLSGEPSVREVLARAQAASEAISGHEDVPFDAIVAEVQPDPGLSGQPLVQVLLTFRPHHPAPGAGRDLAGPESCTAAPGFDLCLELDERAEALTGRFVYSSDLFDAAAISRMTGHWRMVLAGMVAEPSRPAGELPLLTGPETRQLLREWSAGPGTGTARDVGELIGEQARAQPEAIAVVCEGAQLSYRQLDARANQLARHLRALGGGPEVPVGVCLERSADQVVALLGILRAGAAYVPLDPDAPADRLRYVLEDTGMPLLLTEGRLLGRVRGTQAELVVLDRDRALIGQHSEKDLADKPGEGQLAYLIYTSGSTGRPKGVMVERGALSAHCQAMIGEYGLGPQERVLQFSQYSFDASLEQILPALAAGGALVMRGPELWSPRQLLAELKREQVTVMNLPPAYWQEAVRDWSAEPRQLAETRLRLVIVGGDRLPARAAQQWRQLGLTGVRLLNAYGPTETTITATLGDAGQEQVTIGRPLPGRLVYILDGRGRPVPAGVVGELHIGGSLLARGYLNLPDLTSERFVADPFAERPGGRLYRTGDLARYLSDGRIEYVGRRDQQVKIRGYRIELGEVEAALGRCAGVEDAVAVTAGEGGDKELVVYVVAAAPGQLAQEDLRAQLADKLPAYMHPAVIMQLDSLPRLATGKPDRRGLPEVTQADRRGSQGYLAPRLLIEQQLVQIWESLLAARPIGIRDSFFDLGGHSLLAAQLAGQIEQVCGKRLALSTLFAGPTVEQLAEALRDGEEDSERKARVLPVRTAGSRTPFFFLHGDWTGGAFYCFALARACGPQQPFYVLEPYRFSERDGAPAFEAMAAAHIEAMRRVQAKGPYRLGGFCNGGLLAYEMARQLADQGEEVEVLALINPSEPNQFSALRAACARAARAIRAPRRTQADLYLRARHLQRHVYRLLRPGGSRVRDFGQLLAIEPRLASMFPPRDALYRDYVGVFNWIVAGYRTGIYRGPITFYWAREEPAIAQAWQPVIRCRRPDGNAEHLVAGALMSSVTEHIEGIAESLSEYLASADQGPFGAGEREAAEGCS